MTGLYPIGGAPIGDASAGPASISVSVADTLVMAEFLEGQAYWSITDLILTGDSASGELLPWIRDTVMFSMSTGSWRTRLADVSDQIGVTEALRIVISGFAEDDLSLTDDVAGFIGRTAAVVDILRATCAAQGWRDALATVAEALALSELARVAYDGSASDALAMSEDVSAIIAANASLVENLALTDVATATLNVVAIVRDTVDFDDSAAGLVAALGFASDDILIYATVKIGGNAYSGWVLNTANQAFSTYGFNFNSFGTLSGDTYAISDDGIYLMDGDDDDGTAIQAKALTGATDFGTGRQKRMPAVYLGYTADGTVFARVVTFDPVTGTRIEDDYPINVTSRAGPATGRVKLGRGLKSVYWQVGIDNGDGGDFSIGDVTLFPMILDRRV